MLSFTIQRNFRLILFAVGTILSRSQVLPDNPTYMISSNMDSKQTPHINRRILSQTENKKKSEEGIPYDRTLYSNATVNPHNFTFMHKPKRCDSTHMVLVAVHSAIPVC